MHMRYPQFFFDVLTGLLKLHFLLLGHEGLSSVQSPTAECTCVQPQRSRGRHCKRKSLDEIPDGISLRNVHSRDYENLRHCLTNLWHSARNYGTAISG